MYEPSKALGPDSRQGHDGYNSHLKHTDKVRQNPIIDLIDTEKQYVENLRCLIKRITGCWHEDDLPPAELDAMFRFIEVIFKLNKKFYSSLKKIGAQSPETGDILMSWVGNMEKAYKEYCENYFTGFDNWSVIEENENLQRTFMSIASEKNRPVSLDFYFSMPLIRLHYYRKFYMRLFKDTEPGSADHKILAGANKCLDSLLELEKVARTRVQTRPKTFTTLPLKPTAFESAPGSRSPRSPRSPGSPQENNFAENLPRSPKSPMNNHIEKPQPLLPFGSPTDSNLSPQAQFHGSINRNYGLQELEEHLDTTRMIDLFTKQPKKFKVTLRPANLDFQREVCTHDNFVMITQSGDMFKAHLFLLTDLLLICRAIPPEEKRQYPNKEFTLLYPPLSGRHLEINDARDDLLELNIVQKEKLMLRAESAVIKNKWLNEFDQVINFAIQANARIKVKTDPNSLQRSPDNNDLRLSPISGDTIRTSPNPVNSPDLQSRQNYEGQLLSPQGQPIFPNSDRRFSPPQQQQQQQSQPIFPNPDRKFSPPQQQQNKPLDNPPVPPLPPLRVETRILPNSVSTLTTSPISLLPTSPKALPALPQKPYNSSRSKTPDLPSSTSGQYPGDYNPNLEAQRGRRSDPENGDTRAQNLRRSNSTASLASVASIGTIRETIHQTPSCEVCHWRDNTWKLLTTKDKFTIEIRLTTMNKACLAIILEQSGRMVLNTWILPTTTLHRESPTDLSISCEMGNGMDYYRINTPHPAEANQLMECLNRAQQIAMEAPKPQPPPKQYSETNLTVPQYGAHLGVPQYGGAANLAVPTQPTFVSRSSSLNAQEPAREIEQTVTEVMDTRCRVFLQNDHGVWTNLNWGNMKLSLETPSHRKRIVISSDKQRSKLIDAIIWEDGVERVGKTGVAITLSNLETKFRVIYMLQWKDEKTAIKAFELMKEKKVK